MSGSRTRPRRRDLKIGKLRPEVPDEAGDDDDSEGGRGKKWVRVYPLGLGLYGGQTAVFLGRRKEVEKENGGRLEALPVPVFTSGDLEMLRAAFQEAERRRKMEAEGLQDSQGSKSQFKASSMWTGRHLSTKDNGFFDNAPWEWVERTAREAGESGQSVPTIAATNVKKEAFDAFVFGKNVRADWTSSPYALMLHVITRSLGAAVSELLIDEEDSPRGPGITFGPVLTLQEEVGTAPSEQGRATLVDCLVDEVVGFALALNRAIKMPVDLYEGTAVASRVLGRGSDGILQLEAVGEGEGAVERRKENMMTVMENVRPAWEISSVEAFRSMDSRSKRLCLIKSGADVIPKRRQGPQELDIALLPYLDETVRREARIALAVEREDWSTVSALEANKSERGRVKDRLRAALAEGDAALVARLEEEYVRLTVAKMDPTQDEGSYQKDLDQDDWYLRSRRT
ncbi:hypothetical protein NSK_002972 [Nannochloropsis salina CCMP1776]|uniref:Uncharacterized protein n=1 Tax=Nannochloropsis salina CCMP1776 TaxID=1027361 RepID=A0A4D9D1N6_9STRA|nr:hypothetical protein NSK_002972 [Nannochloropsis salina CCMP1776]|eukprot:TFJ85462.1 hypothetical protein NSK_002972 [Nannochloropsis salina CCMP1776]